MNYSFDCTYALILSCFAELDFTLTQHFIVSGIYSYLIKGVNGQFKLSCLHILLFFHSPTEPACWCRLCWFPQAHLHL